MNLATEHDKVLCRSAQSERAQLCAGTRKVNNVVCVYWTEDKVQEQKRGETDQGIRQTMRTKLTLALLPLVILLGSSSGQGQCPQDNFASTSVTYDDVRDTSRFGLELFRRMSNQSLGENLFFSPYSIWSVFTIAYFGAEGNTLSQMNNVLRLRGKDAAFKTQRLLAFRLQENTQGVELNEANRAYIDTSLALGSCFKTNHFYEIRHEDLSNPARVAQEVNSYVDGATNGLIPKLLSPGSLQKTNLLLVNAIYFKGVWKHEFQKAITRPKDFCSAPGKCRKVDMMTRPEVETPYINNQQLGAEVVELPYGNSSISMLLFLPWQDRTVDSVVNQLDLPVLAKTLSDFKEEKIRIEFPKFKMEQTLQTRLIDTLEAMGLSDIFSLGQADLSGFSTTKALSITDAIHKAVVDINEEGTEAAAATALFDTRIGGLPRARNLSFNRPFVFLIVHKELGLVLFSGIYNTPP
ncbi:leukocyte elastase inhibitor-like [Oratosquilla oratoria]|uniref:leukocyte elastase inhibitor-like n=1 Tax=Oratosquilla oratoria TaxID=337810 RepID=UPI003F770334